MFLANHKLTLLQLHLVEILHPPEHRQNAATAVNEVADEPNTNDV